MTHPRRDRQRLRKKFATLYPEADGNKELMERYIDEFLVSKTVTRSPELKSRKEQRRLDWDYEQAIKAEQKQAEIQASSRKHWDYNPRCYNPDGVKVSVVYGAYSNFR